MKEKIIGRKHEMELLNKIQTSQRSEFVAICGRRRVGKTFLVKEFFENEFVFHTSGLANEGSQRQIKAFYEDLLEYGLPKQPKRPKDWLEVFVLLRKLIKQSDKKRKVIFLDELPWMDTPRSGFVSALEHFWNSWASGQRNIVLVVCGSATSWMMDKMINNHGGLHNRLTCQIFLEPFTLGETEHFLQSRGFMFSRYDIAVCYMALGGIPYYLDLLNPQLSLAQNIDQLLFKQNGPLAREFGNLYAALFKNSDDYVKVVEALSKKKAGLSRSEIMQATNKGSGNGLTVVLRNLESCGFIRQYKQYKASRKDKTIYQLVDFFTMFHFYFIVGRNVSNWESLQGKSSFFTWAGLTFELLVASHINMVKKALGISGVETKEYVWRCSDEKRGAQVDLAIERGDNMVNLCEMKFSIAPFSIDKSYEMSLRNKLALFMEYTGRNKSLQLTLVTTYGLTQNTHSGVVSNEITLDDLFD